MVGLYNRCETCDAEIGGAKACRHCGWVRPTAEERADDRVWLAVAFLLSTLVMIVSVALGISPR